MSEVKRHISEVLQTASPPDKKTHSKPGRKPVDTEPKLKRTAQNRAAQRAYRERKEKKMKDLEDKVKSLEDENIRLVTETDFLRAKVEMLKKELARYQGNDTGGLLLPTSVGHLSNPNTGGYMPLFEPPATAGSRAGNGVVSHSSLISLLSKLDRLSLLEPQNLLPELVFAPGMLNLPDLDLTPGSQVKVDFAGDFDEQVDPFCSKLGEACGTKEHPQPQSKSYSPFSSLATPNFDLSDPFFMGQTSDPLSFLNDVNFDTSLAFKQPPPAIPEVPEDAPVLGDDIGFLTTQDLVYDPLTMETTPHTNSISTPGSSKEVNIDFNFNDFVKELLEPQHHSITDEPEVVPALSKVLQCNEVWERITLHPRYADIDIDGLCMELKLKAKCSERGVVINQEDVNYFIEQLARKRL